MNFASIFILFSYSFLFKQLAHSCTFHVQNLLFLWRFIGKVVASSAAEHQFIQDAVSHISRNCWPFCALCNRNRKFLFWRRELSKQKRCSWIPKFIFSCCNLVQNWRNQPRNRWGTNTSLITYTVSLVYCDELLHIWLFMHNLEAWGLFLKMLGGLIKCNYTWNCISLE